jgi:hypothetical protein
MNQNNKNDLLFNINQRVTALDSSKSRLLIDAFNKTNHMPDSNNNINNNSFSDLEKEITMRFMFPNSVTIPVKGKLNKKFIDVFKRFKENDCPQGLKNFSNLAVHGAELIENKKTLAENKIKDGDPILFVDSKEIRNTYNKKESNLSESSESKVEEKSTLTNETKEILKKMLAEFQALKFLEYIKEVLSNPDDSNLPSFDFKIDIDEFKEFIKKKTEQLGIEVKEHDHKLIFCLTNLNWKCNECKKKYDKKIGRYYCSICDFNMCNECSENHGYDTIEPFPEDVIPSNQNIKENIKKSSHHEHQLAYCRTKRTCISCGWICDVCQKNYGKEEWSFYCTSCDFDLCCNCIGN